MSRRSKALAAERRAAPIRLLPWTPFERTEPMPFTAEKLEQLSRVTGKSPEQIQAAVQADIGNAEWWQNSRYLVIKNRERRRDGLGWVWHLSFRRLDRQPVGEEHFRDFQRIKNELLGPMATAFEIYPAEDRLADTSNQYHLWAYEDKRGFEFGFYDRAVLDDKQGLVQRPLDAP